MTDIPFHIADKMSTPENAAVDQAAPATSNEPSNGYAAPEAEQTEQATNDAPATTEEGCRLYVGNLAFKTKEEELKDFFAKFTVYVNITYMCCI